MRDTYLKGLYDLAAKDKEVVSLVADNGLIVYDDFKKDFPDRYFNFGIAEGNMVTAAAGMASCGKIPFIYTINAFLAYRSYEFIRDDVCFQNLNVKIVGIGSGLTYSTLGPSHHTTEDIGLLRGLPNLTVFCPATRKEMSWIMERAYEINGPVYIRLGNNKEEYHVENAEFELGAPAVVKEGKNVTVMTTGSIINEVVMAVGKLEEQGIDAEVVSVHTLKPMNNKAIVDLVRKTGCLVTVEEHNVMNGLYSAIAEVLFEEKVSIPVLKIGLNDCFAKDYGKIEDVRKANEIDAESIYNKILQFMGRR